MLYRLSWEDLGFRGVFRAFVGRDSGFRGEDLGFRGKRFGRSREEIRAFVGLRAFVERGFGFSWGFELSFGGIRLSNRFYESKA